MGSTHRLRVPAARQVPFAAMGRAVLVAVILALAACSAARPATSSVPSTVDAGLAARQYVAAEQRADAILNGVAAATDRLGSFPTSQAVADTLRPAAVALRDFDATLTGIAWPPAARADAAALVRADAAEIGVIESSASQTVFSAAGFMSQLGATSETARAARMLLRHDLGLPAG